MLKKIVVNITEAVILLGIISLEIVSSLNCTTDWKPVKANIVINDALIRFEKLLGSGSNELSPTNLLYLPVDLNIYLDLIYTCSNSCL